MRIPAVKAFVLLLAGLAAAASGCATRAFICPEGTSPVWGKVKPYPELPERDAVVCRSPDGVAHGPSVSWVGDALDSVGHFNEGKLVGSFVYFDRDGRVRMLGHVEDGQLRDSTQWDEHGRKDYEHVARGGGTALTTLWYPDGAPRLRAAEVDGEFHGLFETWYESGSRKAVGHYKNGRKIGTWRCWDEDGDRELVVTFGSDGRLEGKRVGDEVGSWTRGCTATCYDPGPRVTEVASVRGSCSNPAD